MFKFNNVKDLIILSVKNIKQKRLSKKLADKLLKSFKILKFIEKQAYKLVFSITYQIHNIFYMLFLKLYNRRLNDFFISNYFLSKLINNKKEYKINKILINVNVKKSYIIRFK